MRPASTSVTPRSTNSFLVDASEPILHFHHGIHSTLTAERHPLIVQIIQQAAAPEPSEFVNQFFLELTDVVFSSFCGYNFSVLLQTPSVEMLERLNGDSYFDWLFQENYDEAIEVIEERFAYLVTWYQNGHGNDGGDSLDLLHYAGYPQHYNVFINELTDLASYMTLFIRDLFLLLYPQLQMARSQTPFPIGDVFIERCGNSNESMDLLVDITAATVTNSSL